MPIGRIEKLALRTLWGDEAKHFTPWLKDNIDILAESIGIKILAIEKEKDVGDFSVDLLGEDEDGNPLVIENQFGKTDHDHLGKAITYLTNLEAKTAIWITETPRSEHTKAINWLNESTPPGVSFYLVKVEAIRIGNSDPAPLFSIVAAPSQETKEFGQVNKEWAERHFLRQKFWTKLLEKASKKTDLHSNISPGKYHWIGTGSGISGVTYNYVITFDEGSTELYIDKGDQGINKSIFDQLFAKKDEIEKIYGEPLSWERLDEKRACRIAKHIKSTALRNEEEWDALQDRMIDSMIRLEKALSGYIEKLR